MVRPVKVAAGVAGATPLLVVHADGDAAVLGDAHAVGRVCEATFGHGAGAETTSELTADLERANASCSTSFLTPNFRPDIRTTR